MTPLGGDSWKHAPVLIQTSPRAPFPFDSLGLYSAEINLSLQHYYVLRSVSPSELGGGLGVPLDYFLGWM